MRVEIAGRGANARYVHVIGERDLIRGPSLPASAEGVTIALEFKPERAIQVKLGETRVHLSVEEVFGLIRHLSAALGLSPAEVRARLETVPLPRAAGDPPDGA